MSKKIVEMYDGEIEVESEPGDGTAFRVSMNVVRTFLAFLIVSLLSIGGAGAVEKLEINSDQNESYLPLKFVHQDSIALGSHSAYVSYMSSMLSPTVVGDTGKAHYLSINPASVLNDGAMTFDYTSFPPRQLVHQRAVQIRRFHWETYQDPGMDRPGVFGAGRWMDTAWAIYFDPFTREIEKKFLMTGEDGTGDGKWMPEFSIPLVEDYDYDGRAEAFVWVNRVREKGVRTLFCIEAQTLDIEWSIPVASGIGPHNGFFSLRDSTNPGIIFACNGSQQGASDSNFSDMYGYLTVINSRGEITFSCVSRVGTDGHVLSRSHADGLYYLTHDMDFISHDSMMALEAINGVAALRDGKHRISLIDRNGNTCRSCDLEQPGWDCWTMPYGSEHETAVYMRSLDKRVRVFDTSLTLLAVSEPTDIGTFVDRISVSGYGDVLQFGNGLYSLDLTQLARQEGILDMQPMVTDSAGALVRVLIPNSRWMTISDIEMRSTWELLGIFYVNNKNYFLAAISSLLVGLLVMNAYRGRAKRNLVLISEQKRELEDTHRALKEAQARIVAQERYEQARDIAGGFAHEIRNALSPARNALTRLVGPERKSLSDDKAEKLSRLVDRAVVRAVDLTQLISSYTRLEAARNPEDVDIRNVIDDVLRSNALVFEDRGIDVTVSSEDVPSVTCNLDQSVVVVDNLVKNAVDALVGVEEPRIEISLLYKGETVELLFTDNGCGIREECRGRVFDFFYSTKPDTGTGVGLAMVKKIVEMYGGGIEVESEPHSGTTFRLQLRTI